MNYKIRKLFKAEYLIPTVVILTFVTVAIQRRLAVDDLKENGVIVKVTIVDYLGSTKGGSGANPNFECNFLYKGKSHSLISPSSMKEKAFSYVGKSYPALYSEKTNTLRLLISPDDFSKFGVKQNDSVNQE